ncbi:KRI1-like family C-terminal-domain-containing protein [Radiomyces spectabilis]|uniref:KRI1-like family C-terminal-domain-containing protein n=1 Tax=Radiomyces spectabilis TaxID=64574 RepID=UPI00221E3E37|nr:KRI1-like family C-terminal-domain-containing protein [Radiomyces spectabilis]KAI8393517.1 KRI1-like family C-terminal-domain-containing protein [Radiomyces spectabilis]
MEDFQRPASAFPEEENESGSEAGSNSEEEENDEEEEDEESESEDEEEDETAALLTPALDSQILRTIAAIQTKDPKVYDTKNSFFSEEQLEKAKAEWEKKQKEQKNKEKKMTLKEYQNEVLLKHGGFIEEEEQAAEEPPMTHTEEQDAIKKAFKAAAFGTLDDEEDEEEEEDDFLTKRDKTHEEQEAEEEDYKSFLLENMAGDEAAAAAFKEWHNYKDNPNLSADDAFLIDYVLNRGWVDKREAQAVPTYEEVTAVDRDEDEEYLDQVDRFESKYNFRFEEDGGAQIISHARNIEGTVRREESRRKRNRERKKAKREALKQQKMEEVKRLKNEKMKEIHERLKQIQEITGTEVTGLENLDLEGDFDPEKYDSQMAGVFDDQYYEGEENEKPVWDDDIEGYESQEEAGENYNDDDDMIMDADYLPGGEKYGTLSNRKKRKLAQMGADATESDKVKLAKTVENSTGVDAAAKSQAKEDYEKLMDEYYSLNFEDIIGGDLPTRFKYAQTEPEDYGLTAEEILLADDKELNKYIGMKALAPYRNERKKAYEKKQLQRAQKSKLRTLRRHIDSQLERVQHKNQGYNKHKHQHGSGKHKHHDSGKSKH